MTINTLSDKTLFSLYFLDVVCCFVGYTGELCQSEIDHCIQQPCQNGGTCSSNINGFSCQCPEGKQQRPIQYLIQIDVLWGILSLNLQLYLYIYFNIFKIVL